MSNWFWVQFAMICIVGAMSPGPSMALIIRNSIKFGRVSGILSSVGHALGIGIYAGIGGRRFGEKMYWGWNVLAGRYLNHDRVIFNFEFLNRV